MARAADTSAATPAAASAPAANPAAAAEAAKKKVEEEKAAKEAALHAPFDESLFFSPQDLIAISKAQKGAESNAGGYNGAPIPQKRVITLSGIIYRSPSDWLIWINGQKIVPGRLLPEIVDIQVHENSVHMKWFDIGLNGVIDITMHPHETYDIVTGILLPGSG
ncbi:MAG: hypothetical protein GC185_10275 [Alphaproteobacteria bacterium]|nr:hypothetical protein [Alphaproteobacteria bacterium]